MCTRQTSGSGDLMGKSLYLKYGSGDLVGKSLYLKYYSLVNVLFNNTA